MITYHPRVENLRPIPDLRTWYPQLGFSGKSTLDVDSGQVVIIDPIYLGDIYNESDDEITIYIRQHAVIVSDFGGDVECPVYWNDPFVVLPTAANCQTDNMTFGGWEQRSSGVGCDSGSFAFLALNTDIEPKIHGAIECAVESADGVSINLPDGIYDFKLEQLSGYQQPNMAGLYRNIVALRTAPD